jgi:hypothetical protein
VLELAQLALDRVGERALLVTEQLAFEQRVLDGGTVEGDQRLPRPRAVVVDRLRDQLFAGPALTGDEHGGLHRGGGEHRAKHLLHLGCATDDVVDLVAFADFGAEVFDLADELGFLGRLVERDAQLVDVERLGEVVSRPELDRRDRGFDGLGGGQHDDRQLRPARADLFEQLQAVDARHHEIEQDDVGAFALEDLQCLGGGGHGHGLVGVAQHHADRLPYPSLVVDDQYPFA